MASNPPNTYSNPNTNTNNSTQSRQLNLLDPSKSHTFIKPIKRINEGHDVPHFLTSRAYTDIGIFVMQLNIAMCPRKISSEEGKEPEIIQWTFDSCLEISEPVSKLQRLLEKINDIIEEAPPDTGPRRFGNVSFRKWYEILEMRARELLKEYLPRKVLEFGSCSPDDKVSALDELTSYLLGGFGSAQRLDYGTGHELSFLAFLGGVWKLGGFSDVKSLDGELERSIVMGVIEPYLRVVRRLILTYTLEPAGSHGVWGLDDHSFLPYIFGSSQYCPAITSDDAMPIEGSLPNSPNPGDVAKKKVVDEERKNNMYFSAIGFINDVKTGPFWEHSPILFDISGIRTGWGKINKGMIKMYNAEVLSKFPVVQHFPFGSLFSWEKDPNAGPAPQTVHTANQPTGAGGAPTARPSVPTLQMQGMPTMTAPWANTSTGTMPATSAPWATATASRGIPSTIEPPVTTSLSMRGMMPATRAPWSTTGKGSTARAQPQPPISSSRTPPANESTRAPWAR